MKNSPMPIGRPTWDGNLKRLLSSELDPFILRDTRAYLVARGARTIFAHICRWPEMNRVVRYEILNTIEKVDH